MKQRARDLQLARQEAAKRGAGSSVGGGGRSFRGALSGFGSDTPKPGMFLDDKRISVCCTCVTYFSCCT